MRWRMLLVACGLSVPLVAAREYAPPLRVLTPRWQAYYPFEDLGRHAADLGKRALSGEPGHPARNVGAVLTEQGVRGKAARLKGKSYLAIPDFPGGRGYTVAAWVRTDFADYQYVLAKGNNLAGSFYLRLQKGGRPRTAFLPGDNATTFAESSRSINDGKWHHLAATFDGYEIRLYIDGKLDVRTPFAGRVPTYRRLTYIGAFDVAEDDGEPDAMFFQGDLDDLRLMDCAATAETVARWARR